MTVMIMMVVRTIIVNRYVTPLREGGSMPAIVEGDDLEGWSDTDDEASSKVAAELERPDEAIVPDDAAEDFGWATDPELEEPGALDWPDEAMPLRTMYEPVQPEGASDDGSRRAVRARRPPAWMEDYVWHPP